MHRDTERFRLKVLLHNTFTDLQRIPCVMSLESHCIRREEKKFQVDAIGTF
jgi:hypothetical protein